MRILFMGTSPFAEPALRALVAAGETVVTVVTQPDRPAGRGKHCTPPPVKLVAEALGLPVAQPESCREAGFIAEMAALEPDLSVVVAYGQFLPDTLRLLPRLGTVNIHGSLLPQYRGAAPIARAIWAGETRTGVSLMWMTREMDAGDVIACADTTITEADTCGTVSERLSAQGADLLCAWLSAIAAGSAPRHAQDAALVSFAPTIKKEERAIDWRQSAVAIQRQVRALAPAPSAISSLRGTPVKLLAVELTRDALEIAGEPGDVVVLDRKKGFVIITGEGSLWVREIQPAGGRAMTGAEFLHGHHLTLSDRFL